MKEATELNKQNLNIKEKNTHMISGSIWIHDTSIAEHQRMFSPVIERK